MTQTHGSALKFLVIIFALSQHACLKKESQSVEYRAAAPIRSSKDFLIPRDMREHIERKYIEFIRKNNTKIILEDGELLDRIPREFLDVDVKFRSSAPGVLSNHVVFKMTRGGGLIDLKDHVRGPKGSFYLSFDVRRSADPQEDIKPDLILFLSEARSLNIDKETYGLGCKKYAEITNQILVDENTGFHLNATDKRYVPVIGGVFYFVSFDPDRKIYLSAIRIIDSRYPEMFCEESLI